jgi:hypothetical protein
MVVEREHFIQCRSNNFIMILSIREQGVSLSISNIVTFMRNLLVDIDSTFKASYSWADGFMPRYGLKLRKPSVYVSIKDWG